MLLILAMFRSLGVLAALLVFIALIQVAQNFILCRERDVYFSIAISLMLMLFSASESTSGFFIVYLAGFAIACTFVLVSLHSEKMAYATNQSPEIKQSNSTIFPASITALGFSILIVTTAVYLAMPQLPAGHIGSAFGVSDYYYRDRGWEREADNGSQPESSEAGTESTSGDHPAAPRTASDGDRFFRDSDGNAPSSGTPGERDDFGEEREGQEHTRNQTSETHAGASSDDRRETLDTNQFHYAGFNSRMNIEAPRDGGLSNARIVAANYPVRLQFPPSVVSATHDGILSSPQTIQAGTRYTVFSESEYMETLQSAGQIINESASAVTNKPLSLERMLANLRDGLLYLINTVLLLALRGWELIKVPLLFAVAVAVVGAGCFYAFRIPTLNLLSLLRVKLLPVGDPGRFVRSVYSELEGVLSRRGYSRARSDTIEEYQELMREEDFLNAFSALSGLYSQVDYGNYQPTKSEAQSARSYYLRVYQSL